jgi:type IV secretion system protein VirB4
MKGDWHDLGGALSDSASEPVALQPLAMIDDAAERGWAAEWIAAVLTREKIDMTPEAKEHLWSALSSLASAPAGERTLTGLSVLAAVPEPQKGASTLLPRRPLWARCSMPRPNGLEISSVQVFETEGLIGTERRTGGPFLSLSSD